MKDFFSLDSGDAFHALIIRWDRIRDIYSVEFNHSKFEASTLADALHDLANSLDAARIYGSEKYDRKKLHKKKVKPCKYCGAPIFFALSRNRKWIPMEAESFDAKDVDGTRAFLLLDVDGSPNVASISRPQGQVWITHAIICGLEGKAPTQRVLRKKWTENRKNVAKYLTKERNRLINMIEDMEN